MTNTSNNDVNIIKMFDNAITLTNLITYVKQQPLEIQVIFSDLYITLTYDEHTNELVCGCKSVDGKTDELRLGEEDDVENLVTYIFNRSIKRYEGGGSSGLSDLAIYSFLSLLIDDKYPINKGDNR